MRNITEEARLVMNTRRDFVNYARVTLHDGTVLNLMPSDFRISGNTITDAWCEGEAFQLGSVIGKTASILLDNTDGRIENIYTLQTSAPSDWTTNYRNYYTYFDYEYIPVTGDTTPIWSANTYYTKSTVTYLHGKFSEYDFYMSYFELYIHLPKSTHYNGELIDTVIPIGTFTVTEPASHGATIEITGVDNMYMFDKPFNDCTLNFDYHPTLLAILNRCCQDCGVAIGYTGFTNETITVTKKPKDITYRQVVSYIAQIAGCNAVIGTTGALQLKWYNMSLFADTVDGGRFLPWDGKDNTRDTLDGGSFNPWTEGNIVDGGNFTDSLDYHNLTATNGTSVSTDDIQFTGVMVSYEVVNESGSTETQALHYPNVSNWDTYAMKIEQNPFIESQSIATIVANTIWSAIGGLKFRVFSCQSIQDPTIEAGDCALVYDVKGNIYQTVITNVTYKTGGMTDVSCHAESPLKQNTRYVNSAARAVAKAEQRQDDYNAMVAHFNELAYASTSYYETTISGVKYLHDMPSLAASTNVIKITGNGTFISTDGGQSYNAGVDTSTATMLMNLIYVKGLNADWIKAGSIDADIIDVYHLNANNISSGTISCSMLNGGTINGQRISGGTITSATLTSNTITSTTITGGTITGANITSEQGTSLTQISGGAISSNNVDLTGTINAKYGTIGSDTNKWNIGAKSIYNGCLGIDNGNSGTYVGIDGIRNNNADNDTFVRMANGVLSANNVRITGGTLNVNGACTISAQGVLHATGADIQGTITTNNITATGGNIGGCTFANSKLQVPSAQVTGEFSAAKITTGNLKSANYSYGTGGYAADGMIIQLADGVIRSKNFKITASGEASFRGEITSTSGTIGGFKIKSNSLGDEIGEDTCVGMIKGSKLFTWSSGAKIEINFNNIKMATGGGTGKGLFVYSGSDFSGNYVQYGHSDVYRSSDGKNVQWGSSDRRLKKDIEDLTLEEAKALVYSVRPRKFRFKKEVEEKGERFGFIAQELRETLDEDSGIEYTNSHDYHNVHYDDFIAPLCMIVKKQQAEIDDLKERLAKLESIVNTNV